jgi:hypothetical protein
MQYELIWIELNLIVKVKTCNFYMNCYVVYLKLTAVVDHKLLTSATNLVNLVKEISLNLNSISSSHSSVV